MYVGPFFIALVTPVHAWGRVLFSAYMSQHEILMLVAAPLLALGRPLIAFLWALPLHWSRRLGNLGKIVWINRAWRTLTIPLVAWLVHAIALWIWHIPALFEATLYSEAVHTLQHLSFLLSALLFWWAIIHGPQGAMGYGAAVLYLFTTSVHSGALGALITLARARLLLSRTNATARRSISRRASWFRAMVNGSMLRPGGETASR